MSNSTLFILTGDETGVTATKGNAVHYKSRFLLKTRINLVEAPPKLCSRIGNSPWGIFQIFQISHHIGNRARRIQTWREILNRK